MTVANELADGASGPPTILVSEVGPRDGLQSVDRVMPTAAKLAWIDALYGAGIRDIEVDSLVPANLLPQMADTATIVAHTITLPGLTVMAFVSNLRGAQAMKSLQKEMAK